MNIFTLERFTKVPRNRGIVGIVVILVIALLILSYYGISIRQTVQSPAGQDNFSYVWGGIEYVWDTYLKAPLTYLYNLYVNVFLKPSIADFQNINAGRLPNAENNLPNNYPNPPYVR